MDSKIELTVEARRLAIETIATLVHIKGTMAELLLKPAGITPQIYKPFLALKDETTGRAMSKRKIAPLLLEKVETCSDCEGAILKIIKIASTWDKFHLADKEYEARATVQKAREFWGIVEAMEAREAKQRELALKESLAKLEKEKLEELRQEQEELKTQLDMLLNQFDSLFSGDAHQRGYILQGIFERLFSVYGIATLKSFTRNNSGEQIDGAFVLDGWHYLVECRWRTKLSDIRELDGLDGQLGRSGKQTMGLFLSINGWSENVIPLLKQNPNKSIILMEGYDLRMVLSGQVNLVDFIKAKLAKLNLECNPYLSALEYLQVR